MYILHLIIRVKFVFSKTSGLNSVLGALHIFSKTPETGHDKGTPALSPRFSDAVRPEGSGRLSPKPAAPAPALPPAVALGTALTSPRNCQEEARSWSCGRGRREARTLPWALEKALPALPKESRRGARRQTGQAQVRAPGGARGRNST